MTPASKKILALLAMHPLGIRRDAIAANIEHSEDYTYSCLRELRDAGLCGPSSSSGHDVRWGLAENLPAIRAHIAEERRKRKNALDAASKARRRERERIIAQRERDAADEKFLQMRQSIVPALSCQPIKVRAPASVFHLAEAA